MNDQQPARPARAPWRTGDIPAIVAYLKESVTGLNPGDEVERRNDCRIYAIATINAIQSDSTLSSSAKNRSTVATLEALRRVIGGASA